jgi:hypothetical protein
MPARLVALAGGGHAHRQHHRCTRCTRCGSRARPGAAVELRGPSRRARSAAHRALLPSRDSGDAAQAIPAIGVSALLCVILTIMPTSVFAACIYWRAGQLPSWSILLAIIVGLWGGTDLGAGMATHLERTTLRCILVLMVTAMALYMAWRAPTL